MYVEEPASGKSGDGIYVRKRKIYIILAIVTVVFLVALIFVYTSAKGSGSEEAVKKCPTSPQLAYTTALMTTPPPPLDLNKECSAAICTNPYKALGKLLFKF